MTTKPNPAPMARRPTANDPAEFLRSKLSAEDWRTYNEMMDLQLDRLRETLLQWGDSGVHEPRALGIQRMHRSAIQHGLRDARDLLDARPKSLFRGIQDGLRNAHAKEVAKHIKDLAPLLDDIRDRRRHLKAMRSLTMLLDSVYAVGLNEGAPSEEIRAEFKMMRSRAAKTERVKQRHARLQPLVDEMKSKFPSESPAKIAGQLLKRKGFKAQFRVSRRTLETDVASCLAPPKTE
jgi:hypothetical protein